jgi:hypothetical protein
MDLSTRPTGSDFKDIDNPTIHTTSLSGRLYTDAVLESLGLRLGGVDVYAFNRHFWILCMEFRYLKSDRSDVQGHGGGGKYFELSSHPGSGALVLHSVKVTPRRCYHL